MKDTTLLDLGKYKWVVLPNGCWQWLGPKDSKGYGRGQFDKKTRKAHRVMYEIKNGEISGGLALDHLCRKRDCVNPDHLEPVSLRENVLRGYGYAAKNARKTLCCRGHELSGSNLYICPNGQRACKECKRILKRKYRSKK